MVEVKDLQSGDVLRWLSGQGERWPSSFARPASAPAKAALITPSTVASGMLVAFYQTCGGPDSLRWFWSLTVNGPMTRADRVATLEEAKAQFQKTRFELGTPSPPDWCANRAALRSDRGEKYKFVRA